jgi:SSS family solute:Na+ symporter
VTIGRITTACGTVLAIAISPLFGHYNSIIEGLNKLISYAAPPITAVVIGGIFTRWATARAAAATLIVGMLLGATCFALDWFKVFNPDYMLMTFLNCVACFGLLYWISRRWPEQLSPVAETCVWQGWRSPEINARVCIPAAGVICVFVTLYVCFW